MNKKRLLYLDNLKVCLTVLVIFHHAGQAYGDGTSFDRQGAKVFVQKKLIRLGIPLLLMGGLISILSGKPEIGHMWFCLARKDG